MTDQNNASNATPVPRREMLRSVIGLGIAGAAGEFGRASAEDRKPNGPARIDAHAHIWTNDTARYPLAAGFRLDDMNPADFPPEELMRHTRPAGVSRVVLIQMSFYGYDNSYMLDAIAAAPDAHVGVAVINASAANPAEEMRRLKKLGVRGFRIYPYTNPLDTWLDGEGFAAMWKTGAQERLAMCHLIGPGALPAVDRMCQRFPETPVVIDHMARIGADGQIRDEDVAALARLARHKQAYVKVSAFYALGRKTPPYDDLAALIQRVYEAFGPRRLMWASDCPFQVQGPHRYHTSWELVAERLDFLSAEDRGWLLGKTAQEVFFS